MEINFVYSKTRAEFGRHHKFTETDCKVLLDIESNGELASSFIDKKYVDRNVQYATQQSEHEANTELHCRESRGMNHTEGGWPRDINCSDAEQVARVRKKMEKDENYVETVKRLAETMERYIRQNNSIDIYESYFTGESALDIQNPSISTVVQFCDPSPYKRPISCLSWYTDGPRKVAASYIFYEAREAAVHLPTLNCYIWDVEFPHKPEVTLQSISQVSCLAYNPKEPHMLAGGLHNGQVALWDTRVTGMPFESSDSLKSHRDVANCLQWIQSKSGNELFTSARDGQVLWWDTRKISEATEVMYLDPTRRQDPSTAVGAECLEYEITTPTKFLAGCTDGSILVCNRKAKSASEKVAGVYGCSIKNPVYGLQRNPFFPKFFISSSGYQARLWSEDLKDTSIWSTKELTSLMASSCWSPARPSIFYSTNEDGVLSCWNLLANQMKPIYDLKVSKKPLRCIKAHDQGRYLVVGEDEGIISVLQVSQDLIHPDRNEKKDVMEFLERETKREKSMEQMKKEKKGLKDKGRESSLSRCMNTGETQEGFYERISRQFLSEVNSEHKFSRISLDAADTPDQ